jgi:hypothetical protein
MTNLKKPKTRGDCIDGPRPCPWVSCKYHLYLEVKPSGRLVVPRPEVDLEEMEFTCALDAAEDHTLTLDEISVYYQVSRERIRQIEMGALRKLRRKTGLRDFLVHWPRTWGVWEQLAEQAPHSFELSHVPQPKIPKAPWTRSTWPKRRPEGARG